MKILHLIAIALTCIIHNSTADEDEAILSIKAFQVLDDKGTQILNLDDSGVLYMSGLVIGRIDPQGRIWDKEEKEISHLQKDGSLCWADGQLIGKVTPDGTIKIPNSLTLSWDSEGQMNIEDDEVLSLIPADSKSRRTASVAFLTCFTARQTKGVNQSR